MTSKSNSSKNSYLISGSLLTFLSIFPFIVVWLLTPQDKVFVGGLINIDDLSVYLSAIRQGAEGNWLFNYQFTSEPITPKYTYIIYILAEHLMRIVGGTSLIWFHTLRLLSGIFTLWMLYKLINKIFPNNPQTQYSAWLLCCFGSGTGWILVALTPLNSPYLTDLNTPEWSIISAWLSAPIIF